MINVLLVEDDAWMADSMAGTLEAQGYVVQIASDALSAIETVDDIRPQVIVLDMQLPGPNGMVLLHELQSHEDLAVIPVVLCSTGADDIDPAAAAQYGVRRIIDKITMVPADLPAAVRAVMP